MNIGRLDDQPLAEIGEQPAWPAHRVLVGEILENAGRDSRSHRPFISRHSPKSNSGQ